MVGATSLITITFAGSEGIREVEDLEVAMRKVLVFLIERDGLRFSRMEVGGLWRVN